MRDRRQLHAPQSVSDIADQVRVAPSGVTLIATGRQARVNPLPLTFERNNC